MTPRFVTLLTDLRNAALVDYIGVAAAKLPMLEQLYSAFRVNHLQCGTARAEAFRKFQREGGAALERYATFEALAEHFRGDKSGHFPWRALASALPRSQFAGDGGVRARSCGSRDIPPVSAVGGGPAARFSRESHARRAVCPSAFTATSRSVSMPTAPKPGPNRT